MKRFLPWLIPIVLLLAAIPVLLMGGVTAVAKIFGVAVVILTTVAVRFWLYNANRLRARSGRVRFTVNERHFLNEVFPLYRRMSGRRKSALEEQAGILLAEIAFDRFDRKDAGREECVAFAVVLALAVRDRSYNSCRGKVVVFREEASPELIFQNDSPVLFVAEEELLRTLRTVDDIESDIGLPPELRLALQRFYAL